MSFGQSAVIQVLLRERVRISGSVMAIVRDAHAVDDIFQQVALQAIQSREPFSDAEHVLAWALRTARHRAIDLVRARKALCLDAATLDLLEQQWATHPASEISDRVEGLRRCLDGLAGPARSLLRLRYEEGLSCARVAERLHHSLDAVYQSLSRLHRQLRHCVEQYVHAHESIPDQQPVCEGTP